MLSPAEAERVKAVAGQAYPLFSPFLCALFNEQLAECRGSWEVEDWLSRVALTARWYAQPETRPVPRAASAKIQFG